MSSEKKDLTRIEDLGEYIHELNADDDFPSDLPDLPGTDEDEVPAFDSSFESSSFESETNESSEESGGLDFGSSDDFSSSSFNESDSFSSDFSSDNDTTDFSDSNTFGESTDFGSSTDFETSSDFGSSADVENSSEFADSSEFLSGEETSSSDFTSSQDEEPKTESVSDDLPTTQKDSADETGGWNPDIPLTEEVAAAPVVDTQPDPTQVMASMTETRSDETYKAPETFEDLKKFSENTSFGVMSTEGNPSFSVLVKNVRYIEDIQDIISLLNELNLLIDGEEQTKNRLMRGMLLIPRISEYAAIYLAHKLRRFDVDIEVGLSDEIHPPKHQEKPETGIVSKHNLYQNQSHHFHFDDPKLDISQIIVSATPTLEGYQVVKYIGVASEHKMLDGHVVEDENSNEVPAHYQELAQKLKAHALKANSNAVVGLNYQLTPIPGEFGINGHKYRLTCTGNLVWVNKL